MSSPAGKTKSVALGLEVKWTGGYLVAPPSHIVPDAEPDGVGGSYTWVRPPVGPNLPKVPKWLWRIFSRDPQPQRASSKFFRNGERAAPMRLAALVKVVEANGPGSANRDNILFWAANRAIEEIKQGNYSGRSAYDALFAAGLSIGQSQFEVRRALREVGKLC
jgi:hypothetical protein